MSTRRRPNKNCVIAIFLHFDVYLCRLLRYLVVFYLRKAYKSLALCRNCPEWQSAKSGKYNHKTPHNFNKTVVCSHGWPLWHPPPSLGHWCTCIPSDLLSSPSNSTTFLGLCSLGDYSLWSPQLSSPPSTLQKRGLLSLFMIVFLHFGPKRCCSILVLPSLMIHSETAQHWNIET